MPLAFTCSCGEALRVEENLRDRKVFCPKCRKSVAVPADAQVVAASAEPKEFDAKFEPRHVERVAGSGGEPDRWKLTCYCGKRIVSPLKVSQETGRCPKCGRRLRLPGYRPELGGKRSKRADDGLPPKPVPPTPGLAETLAGVSVPELAREARKPAPLRDDLALRPVSNAPAGQAGGPPDRLSASSTLDLGRPDVPGGAAGKGSGLDLERDASEDEIGTIVMEFDDEILARETGANKHAAVKTADILRAHKISTVERSGLISAWPLAGKLPRALAGFIDLTFATSAMGLIVILASAGVLPAACKSLPVALAAFMAAGLINDFFMQFAGGTVGKRLVVLTVRRRGGREPGPGSLALRALLKWLLIPGWLVALVDPAERTLHDILCGTLVLKGRNR